MSPGHLILPCHYKIQPNTYSDLREELYFLTISVILQRCKAD
ncbi:hypothetical protein T07_2365 [Trichinella nelsoni]|uniref:Uncharacterized protein n=1 Tax=Trichinella nelsoni TaxID=6336 RepID=A0A0V0RAB4_9BILA|nr:hypothetical protein T07_2365 [Trichinella nelsoni]